MALCSHCHFGLSAKPSAMSPTLQLSTFIKRLQTPPHAHWQDWGKPTEVGRSPRILWKIYWNFELVWYYFRTCEVYNLSLCMRTQVQRHAHLTITLLMVRRSRLYLLLLWSSICQGFSYSININKFIFIAMTNSKHSFVPLVINCSHSCMKRKGICHCP